VAGGGYECSSKAAGLSSVYNFLGGWAEVYILQNKMAMHMLCSSMKVGPSTHASNVLLLYRIVTQKTLQFDTTIYQIHTYIYIYHTSRHSCSVLNNERERERGWVLKKYICWPCLHTTKARRILLCLDSL
jgi:hypothetical protein